MSIVSLEAGPLSLRVSTRGGLVLGFWRDIGSGRTALLRPCLSDDVDALGSSCYPLVPFGNRVKDNKFSFEGNDYYFRPNTDWDKHYLHGEGWQADWSIGRRTPTSVEMVFAHEGQGTPYEYQARQRFVLDEQGLTMTLAVENRGQRSLPFGLGWHPYFPMTPKTTLLAPARKFWTEVEGRLPGHQTEIPKELDFSSPAPLPQRWVNNGFEDWSGEACITWPERNTSLHLTADAIFKHAFAFVSDTTFDTGFKRDYFCFEPMSHLADGHNMPDLGGLKVLRSGEAISGSIHMRPSSI
ncbi:aldose 1-epimerase [Rhizobium leguminosarum]|uniref:aldose 1-epimerase n=1 Tax=Rhizobium leguminosarum TaxID=384 RepID=UPI001A912407|nr:aldose 1-epimerase [Rhizobium leguminosarum]MBY5556659.1 aldose 1-epimerase [Rhizobium leguminosarum]MBY5638447.1 aldose 1-epimerase [Rhizobium leguminosarum]MBY5692460.1 aldose 1-epimerase [Rhizobium leguminosarum]MBY5726419.1 aldose 1-epimerase [Rhizobium leguminosarum]MBY5746461.1 aldose 1-epimerase [Rhizobium leguminosarum]